MVDYVRFKSYLMVERGYIGDICAESYIGAVKRWIKVTGIEHPTKADVVDYIMEFHSLGMSYSHIVNTSLALERYSEFMGTPFRLGRPRKPRTIVKDTLSEGEVTRMLAITRNSRERAILGLLAYSGIRNKELCQLRSADVDTGNNLIRILQGKGKKDRIVYMAGECSRMLTEYLIDYPRSSEEFLFTTLAWGEQYNGCALRKLVHVVADRAGIDKRIYPHLFRHSLAVNLLKRGASIFVVKDQLGHVYVESTMIYVHSLPQRTQQEYQFFIPAYT